MKNAAAHIVILVCAAEKYSKMNSKFCFFITIPQIDKDITKEFVFNNFVDQNNPIVEKFMICEEYHQDGNKHHHIYVRFSIKQDFQTINNYIEQIYEKHGNYQQARNERNIITYLSKSDDEPLLYNISINNLNFGLRALKWVKTAIQEYDDFHYGDKFVREHPQHYRYLEHLFYEEKNKQINNDFSRHIQPCYSIFQYKYQEEIKEHWNNIINNNLFDNKNKNIYLYGNSNTFKTTTIKELIKNTKYFIPDNEPSIYQWQEFNGENIIWIDEFNVNKYNMEKMKIIMDGNEWTTNKKNEKIKKHKFNGIMILSSNYPPPTHVPGFCERFKIVKSFLENLMIEPIDFETL